MEINPIFSCLNQGFVLMIMVKLVVVVMEVRKQTKAKFCSSLNVKA